MAGIGDLVTVALNAVQALYGINQTLAKVAVTSGSKYTVSSLPAVTAANQGLVAYAIDGRNSGEAAGAGSGCLVSVNKSGTWTATWSGVTVTS